MHSLDAKYSSALVAVELSPPLCKPSVPEDAGGKRSLSRGCVVTGVVCDRSSNDLDEAVPASDPDVTSSLPPTWRRCVGTGEVRERSSTDLDEGVPVPEGELFHPFSLT